MWFYWNLFYVERYLKYSKLFRICVKYIGKFEFSKIFDRKLDAWAVKDVGNDNWAIFSSEVPEKPGFRNDLFIFQIRRTSLKKVASTTQRL